MKKPYTAPKVYINGYNTTEQQKLQYYGDNDADIIIFKTNLINHLNNILGKENDSIVSRTAILNSINYIPDSLYIEVLSIDKTGLLYYIDILADHISANLNFCNINHSRLKLIEFLQSSVRTSFNIISINDLHLKRPITLE